MAEEKHDICDIRCQIWALARVYFEKHVPLFPPSLLEQREVPECFKFVMVKGGITNQLYKCWADLPGSCPTVLLRIYGQKSDLVINRKREFKVIKILGKIGVGPMIYHFHPNSRLEEWLYATALKPDQMTDPKMIPLIARAVAQLHSLDMCALSNDTLVPVCHPPPPMSDSCPLPPMPRDPMILFSFDPLPGEAPAAAAVKKPAVSPLNPASSDRSESPLSAAPYVGTPHDAEGHLLVSPSDCGAIWHTMEKWMAIADTVTFDASASPAMSRKAEVLSCIRRRAIRCEIAFLRQVLSALAPSVLVFAHNDLLSGNLMYEARDRAEPRIRLIDFEYANFNPAAFDIANHFCESCGFECKWDMFPDAAMQELWVRSYLAARLSKPESEIPMAKVLQVIRDVNAWVLASHMFWAVWAIVQARHSVIDFDYIGYSTLRLEGYMQMRKRSLLFLAEDLTNHKSVASLFNSINAKLKKMNAAPVADGVAPPPPVVQSTAAAPFSFNVPLSYLMSGIVVEPKLLVLPGKL